MDEVVSVFSQPTSQDGGLRMQTAKFLYFIEAQSFFKYSANGAP